MPNEFEISPHSLQTGAQQMARAAEDLMGAVQRLQGQVLGAGSPWGSDQLGSVFGETYTVVTQNGLQALAHLAEILGSVATGIAREADNVQAVDQKTSAGMDSIG